MDPFENSFFPIQHYILKFTFVDAFVTTAWYPALRVSHCSSPQAGSQQSSSIKSQRVLQVMKGSVSHSVASDSLQPYGLQSTRLLRPWNSPGKNIRVSCHFLLQGILTQESSLGLLHYRHIWSLFHIFKKISFFSFLINLFSIGGQLLYNILLVSVVFMST